MLKKSLISATLVLASGVACAANDGLEKLGLSFSGLVSLTSDYRFRGLSQAENDPAIQASFTLAHTSGLYFAAFASNVDVPDGAEENAHLELDPQIGFSKAIKIGPLEPTVDIGAVYYNYPSHTENLSWIEFYGKLIFANVITEGDSLTPSVAYSNDYAGTDNSTWNVNLAYSLPIANTGFGGVASVGYSVVDDYDFSDNLSGDDSYIDWKVGVNYSVQSIEGLSAELAVVGTNIDANNDPYKRAVDTGAVFTISKTF